MSSQMVSIRCAVQAVWQAVFFFFSVMRKGMEGSGRAGEVEPSRWAGAVSSFARSKMLGYIRAELLPCRPQRENTARH